MEITFQIDNRHKTLIKEGYQLNSDVAVESYLSDRMIEVLEKLEKTFLQCPNCGKVVRRVNKQQIYCSLQCGEEWNKKKQPDLPFNEGEN